MFIAIAKLVFYLVLMAIILYVLIVGIGIAISLIQMGA